MWDVMWPRAFLFWIGITWHPFDNRPGKIFAERRHECLHNDTTKILSSVDARVYVYRCMPSLEGLKVLESPLGEVTSNHTFFWWNRQTPCESEMMYSNYYVTGMWCIWFEDFSSISKGRTALANGGKQLTNRCSDYASLRGFNAAQRPTWFGKRQGCNRWKIAHL
jgi:hypothetical protein